MMVGDGRGYTWDMNKNQVYPTDLTDPQWDCIKELIPPAKPGGHPRTLDMRAVVNAILYLTVTGCQWRMLPREYPAWQSVYGYFRQFRDDGTWQRIHDTLRAQVRQQAGRHKHPTAGALDSQNVKTWWTHSACCWLWLSLRRPCPILPEPNCCSSAWEEPARNCAASGSMEPIAVTCWNG